LNLAIFDLDNTLLDGDSDYNWGLFLIKKGIVDAKTYKIQNEQFYKDYQSGKLDIYEFSEFQFRVLKNNTREKLDQLRSEYIEQVIAPMILKKAIDLVENHKKLNDRLLIITATNSFITKPISSLFGIKDLIGTDPDEINGSFTGKVRGIPSFKEGKVERLESWLLEQDLKINDFEKIYFYSDSKNDIPLLSVVTHPVVVNADDELLEMAKQNNWPAISLR
jgi:HAD superfamily hydrolase (TIGR01490 family)